MPRRDERLLSHQTPGGKSAWVGSTTQQGLPLIELFGHLVEKLASDGELVLYRGWQPGKSDSALITTALAAEPSAEATKRLEHEYALAGHGRFVRWLCCVMAGE
jgi:hypothetical protein